MQLLVSHKARIRVYKCCLTLGINQTRYLSPASSTHPCTLSVRIHVSTSTQIKSQ
jgi:hypothetical protein